MIMRRGNNKPGLGFLFTAALSLISILTCLVTGTPHIANNVDGFQHAAAGRFYPTGTKRVYYLSVDEVEWDYAPTGENVCYGRPFDEQERVFTEKAANRVGTVYRKAVFRQYANAKFQARVSRSASWHHLGLLGPALHAQAGDTIVVVLRNKASFPVNFVPQSVGVSSTNPKSVSPGDIGTFTFFATEDSAPSTSSSSSSTLHLYRSSLNGPSDVYAGLLGPLIVTRKGEATADGRPKDVDREVVTVLWVSNENTSPYWDLENKRRAGIPLEKGSSPTDPASIEKSAQSSHDPAGVGNTTNEKDLMQLEESNLMHVINGLVYCNLEGLEMHLGEKTRWYTAGVGNEVDVHSVHWHGHVGVTDSGIHVDAIRLLPYSTVAVDFIANNPASAWLLHCHINDHLDAGMIATYAVPGSRVKSIFPSGPRRTRTYYIQAEDSVWDYAPKKKNVCDSRAFGEVEDTFVKPHVPIEDENGDTIGYSIGSKYLKSRYVQYTDETFSEVVKRDKHWDHIGVMGPVLRVRVGEEILIHFRNNASLTASMHAHGLFYLKNSEGAPYDDGTSGIDQADDGVEPGSEARYLWQAHDMAGPGPSENEESKLWIYHSHKNEVVDTYTGLFGAILVVGESAEMYDEESLTPLDGSKELVFYFSVINEQLSAHVQRNVLGARGNSELTQDQIDALLELDSFEESNLMHSINGFVYCNGPILSLEKNQPVRVYMYSLGTEVDVHTPMFATEVLQLDVGSNRGSEKFLGGLFSSGVLTPLRSGRQELRCNVNDHVLAGMRTLYDVTGGRYFEGYNYMMQPNVHHYIAAEEITWDYAASRMDKCAGEPLNDDAKVFTMAGNYTPGSKYIKASYREYSDGSFKKRKMTNQHPFSGFIGPLLHFEVGDIVRIVFRNNLKFTVNLNVVGLELLGISGKTRGKKNEVFPGTEVSYTYRVPHVAAPSWSDLSSVAYTYYSDVDVIAHTSAGLVGVIAVVRNGDLDREKRLPLGTRVALPLAFNIFREDESPFIQKSISKFALDTVDQEKLAALRDDADWIESNAMHSINGYLYCNNPMLSAQKGLVIRFYAFGFGSESSIHSPIFSGQVVSNEVHSGSSSSGVQILPFNAEPVDVVMTSTGLWAIECGVADHVLAGMKARLWVSNTTL